jgi:uncharacterized protein (TIGR03435 family)
MRRCLGVFLALFASSTQRMNADAVARQAEAPQLLEVFRRELGLKLVKDRTTVTGFVVDRVEPLIEN